MYPRCFLRNLMSMVLISILVCIFLCIQNTKAQLPSKPFFLNRFEIGSISSDALSEYGFNVANSLAGVPSTNLIIRLCSKKSFKLAISSAAIDPLILSEYLSLRTSFKIDFNRVLVDRAENCLGKYPTNTATELWQVVANEILPESKEMIKACQINITDFKSKLDEKEEIEPGTFQHKLAISKLIKELKKNPNAFGSVIAYYLSEVDLPTKQIKRKLASAKKQLRQSGLKSNKYEIRFMIWNGFPEIKKPKNLEVKMVEIKRDCLGITDARKTIIID